MKYQWIMVAALLSGCATSESPELIKGDYYMTGGTACALRQVHPTEKRVLCYDSQNKITGERTAMTTEQLQMYVIQQQAAQAQQSSYVSQPMPVINYPTMQTPQVTPMSPGPGHVSCITTGIYTNCR